MLANGARKSFDLRARPRSAVPNKAKVAGSGTDALSNPRLEKSLLPLPLSKALQELEMVFIPIVTAPTWAKARPHSILALVVNVIS